VEVSPPLFLYWLSVSPVPEHLVGPKSTTIDPDADWMRQAETVPAARFNPRAKKNRYIQAVPMEFIRHALVAGDVLLVLLPTMAEMRMRGASEIAVGPAMWAEVGNPSKGVRARLLGQIACLPENLCRGDQTPTSYSDLFGYNNCLVGT